jgi:hypothetical protein
MKNEHTSARVAKIAAEILALSSTNREYLHFYDSVTGNGITIMWHDIRALAASALTQAPDKATKVVRRKAKK